MIEVVLASVVSNGIIAFYLYLMNNSFPKSVYIMVTIADMFLIGGSRFSYRATRRIANSMISGEKDYKRVLIVGAGAAGALVIKEYRNHEERK